MPAQEVAFLEDDAVVWELFGVDRDNEPTVYTPYALKVRWDGNAGRIRDATGQLIQYDATIITEVSIPLGSIFWQGIYENLDDPPQDLFRSINDQTTKDIRGMEIERVYMLQRFHNSLPSIMGTS